MRGIGVCRCSHLGWDECKPPAVSRNHGCRRAEKLDKSRHGDQAAAGPDVEQKVVRSAISSLDSGNIALQIMLSEIPGPVPKNGLSRHGGRARQNCTRYRSDFEASEKTAASMPPVSTATEQKPQKQ
jgi:hypothetical protein